MRTTLKQKEKDPKVFDPYDGTSQHLAAMADTMGGEGRPFVADSLTSNETLEEIIQMAVVSRRTPFFFIWGLKI
jgi:hypothetical protein